MSALWAISFFVLITGIFYAVWRINRWLNEPVPCLWCNGKCRYVSATPPDDASRTINTPPDIF